MKVSITVPTYNQGPFIAECLESIRVQSYKNFEVIIQDSESKDDTQVICESYVRQDGRFRYYREKDAGQSDAINRGLNRSTGDLWTWVCSDDYYANPNAIEELVTSLQNTSKINAVGAFGKAQFVTEKSDFVGEYSQLDRDIRRLDFKLTWPLSQPSSVLKLAEVKQIGGVKEELHLGMDLDLFIRLLEHDKELIYVPTMVASVRLQPDSKSVKYVKKTAENALALVKLHFGDTGSLSSSAYARELHRIEVSNWTFKLDAFLNRAPGVEKTRRGLHELMREDSQLTGLHYDILRSIWKIYHFFKIGIKRCVRWVWTIYTKIRLSRQ
jgi:glycosyltransferase involved in cell wall biosynthesis